MAEEGASPPAEGAQVPDLSALLAQAQAVQEKLAATRAEMEQREVEGQSGGGAVKIRATCALQFLSVSIDPSAVDPGDVEMLEDLVLAAVRDVTAKVREFSDEAMSSVGFGGAGGLFG